LKIRFRFGQRQGASLSVRESGEQDTRRVTGASSADQLLQQPAIQEKTI